MSEEREVVTQKTARQTRHSLRQTWTCLTASHSSAPTRDKRTSTCQPSVTLSWQQICTYSPYRTSSRHWELWVAFGLTLTGVSDVTMYTSITKVTCVRIPARAAIFLFHLKSRQSVKPITSRGQRISKEWCKRLNVSKIEGYLSQYTYCHLTEGQVVFCVTISTASLVDDTLKNSKAIHCRRKNKLQALYDRTGYNKVGF